MERQKYRIGAKMGPDRFSFLPLEAFENASKFDDDAPKNLI